MPSLLVSKYPIKAYDERRLAQLVEVIAYISLSLGDFDSQLLETHEQFLGINLSVAIKVVHNTEGSTESSNGSCTSGIELVFQSVQHYGG